MFVFVPSQSLPAEPFDTFLSWAPVAYCGKGGQKGQSNRHLCYVDVSAVQSGLPWISFQATGGGGSAGLVPPNSFTQRSEEGDDLRKQLGRYAPCSLLFFLPGTLEINLL